MKLFKLFLAPGLWLLLLAVANMIEMTTWGSSGHPSNGLVMFIYGLLSAPVFAVGGLFYAFFGNRRRLLATRIAVGTNLILIVIGTFSWVSFLA